MQKKKQKCKKKLQKKQGGVCDIIYVLRIIPQFKKGRFSMLLSTDASGVPVGITVPTKLTVYRVEKVTNVATRQSPKCVSPVTTMAI